MQNSDLILYPSISACSMTSRAFMRDGVMYESYASYENSLANNVTGNYTFGHAPNLNKTVQSISFVDVNGTLNVLNSSNSYEEDKDMKTTIGHYALQQVNEPNGLLVSA